MIGVGIAIVIGIPLVSFAVTAAVTIAALQLAIIGAILGYLIGIPWSIWFRLRNGRWPQS